MKYLFSSFLFTFNLYAAEFKINQTVQKLVEPEFVTINISISSDCQPNLSSSKNEVALYANKVLSILQDAKFIDPNVDSQILAIPGNSFRQTKYQYVNNQSVPYCVNTWTTSNQITFRLSQIALYDDLIEALYAISDEASKGNVSFDGPQTVVSFSNPVPGISDKKMEEVKVQAQNEAFKKAIKEFFRANSVCQFGAQPTLTSVSLSNLMTLPRANSDSMARSSAASENPMPIKLDSIRVEASYSITIEYSPVPLDPNNCTQVEVLRSLTE